MDLQLDALDDIFDSTISHNLDQNNSNVVTKFTAHHNVYTASSLSYNGTVSFNNGELRGIIRDEIDYAIDNTVVDNQTVHYMYPIQNSFFIDDTDNNSQHENIEIYRNRRGIASHGKLYHKVYII